MSEFLRMGGYAPFVWSSFGLAAAVLLWNVVSAHRLHAAARARALRRDAAGQGTP
jgi:heme exporter protein CcmD